MATPNPRWGLYAEDLPSNKDACLEPEQPLPGWTAQHGNLQALPREICPVCGGEFDPADIHLHTRVTHGFELAISPDNPTPHAYRNEPIGYE